MTSATSPSVRFPLKVPAIMSTVRPLLSLPGKPALMLMSPRASAASTAHVSPERTARISRSSSTFATAGFGSVQPGEDRGGGGGRRTGALPTIGGGARTSAREGDSEGCGKTLRTLTDSGTRNAVGSGGEASSGGEVSGGGLPDGGMICCTVLSISCW